MKFQHLFSIAALGAISLFSFSACGSDSSTSGESTSETAGTQTPAETPVAGTDVPVNTQVPVTTMPVMDLPQTPAANPAKQEPPQNAAGVWHYTCPKGCKGGAGAANPCAKCGTTLAHNTAYHPTPAPTTTTTTTAPAGISDQTAKPATPKQEPPQNAAGVWHYICPDGCPGGGGSALACQKCSKLMIHNTAYHK